ncbi:hypothetical protein SK3146_02051 [Paenibacillus konkukensis]|uniref:ABC transporter permease n=1 Tax=Paenibacillus konkukensis TaxID=2020716 RepID=A0ABY4RK73_9BACL|nr:hypothetical protein [Paenibacillus konkukensis]UQZ82891.1 hypothetical protein SK3146_02051 [Paenibacillus konkukensis]
MEQFKLVVIYLVYWPSVLVLALTLFRCKPRNYIGQIIFSTIMLAQVSILIQSFGFIYLLSIVQPICMFLCLCLFFRLRMIQALLMVVIGFGFNIVIESPMTLMLSKFNYDAFVQMSKSVSVLPAILLCLINCCLAYLLSKFRIGFSFISANRFHRQARYPAKFYWMILAGFLLIGFTSFSIMFLEKIIMLSIFITLFTIGSILHFSYMRETAD